MFWPNAIVTDKASNKPYSLFTYEGCFSLEEATKVIDFWKQKEDLKVLCAYVQEETTRSIVYLENNVNSLGQVHYENGNGNQK